MTKRSLIKLTLIAKEEIKRWCPRDTGNLEDNGVNDVMLTDRKSMVYVDQSIAPYMYYTNEEWTWRPDKVNPNLHWWNHACEMAIDLIATFTGGKLERVK